MFHYGNIKTFINTSLHSTNKVAHNERKFSIKKKKNNINVFSYDDYVLNVWFFSYFSINEVQIQNEDL